MYEISFFLLFLKIFVCNVKRRESNLDKNSKNLIKFFDIDKKNYYVIIKHELKIMGEGTLCSFCFFCSG